MKIEIWSDFACPYCYIGEKKLEKALEEMELETLVRVNFRSFQLNENAVSHEGEDLNELIAKKYGISYEQARAANLNIIETAKEVGLNYDFDKIKPGNTGLAHEVYKYSEALGKGKEMVQRLFASYFEEGIDISSEKNLLELAKEVGIDEEQVKEVIEGGTYKVAVKEDQNIARQIGISSVPFFVINDKYAVSGAQSVEHFKRALQQAKDTI